METFDRKAAAAASPIAAVAKVARIDNYRQGATGSLDPLRIVPDLGTASDFPLATMPGSLALAIQAIHRRSQAPLALCAFSVIGALSLAGQQVANVIHPVHGSPTPLSLFMGIVAKSGERKSSVDRLACKPIEDVEMERMEAYAPAMDAYETAREMWKERRAKAVKGKGSIDEALIELGPEPTPPQGPKLRLSEPNVEGLLRELRTSPALAVHTAEGGTFLSGHGMSNETKARTVTTLTALWDSGEAQKVRATGSEYYRHRRVSIWLAFQPAFAASFLGDRLTQEQGFLPRFLLAWPESTIGRRFVRDEGEDTLRQYEADVQPYHDALRAMLRHEARCQRPAELALPFVALSGEARRAWFDLHNSVEADAEAGKRYGNELQPFALRMAENALRLAGLFTVYEDPRATSVTMEAVQAAIAVVRFSMAEAARIIGAAPASAVETEAQEILDWLRKERGTKPFSMRVIQRHGPNRFARSSAKHLMEIITSLIEVGAVHECEPGTLVDGAAARKSFVLSMDAAS